MVRYLLLGADSLFNEKKPHFKLYITYKKLYLTKKNRIMGYTARNIETNEVYYSRGASKIAVLIGCTGSTITKFFLIERNKTLEKVFKGWVINKTIDLKNKDRGGVNTNFTKQKK